MTTDIVLLYVTCPDRATALALARTLLARRLIACANVLAGMTSVYVWEGEPREDEEVVLILKTRAALAEAATEAVTATHPYDTPAVLVLPVAGGAGRFLAWVRNQANA